MFMALIYLKEKTLISQCLCYGKLELSGQVGLHRQSCPIECCKTVTECQSPSDYLTVTQDVGSKNSVFCSSISQSADDLTQMKFVCSTLWIKTRNCCTVLGAIIYQKGLCPRPMQFSMQISLLVIVILWGDINGTAKLISYQ